MILVRSNLLYWSAPLFYILAIFSYIPAQNLKKFLKLNKIWFLISINWAFLNVFYYYKQKMTPKDLIIRSLGVITLKILISFLHLIHLLYSISAVFFCSIERFISFFDNIFNFLFGWVWSNSKTACQYINFWKYVLLYFFSKSFC